LSVKLTKLGKQLQANQIMLHEIKTILQQNKLAKSNASQVECHHEDGVNATDGNTAAESDP